MKQEATKPILIIGAGLSGLAVGRLLTNNGIPNIVFEASGPERSQGFSISLRDWGYEALLGALGSLPLRSLTRGVAPDRQIGGHGYVDLIMRDNTTGDTLVAPDPATQPAIVRANRNALRRWIADCGDDELDVRYGHKLQNVEGSIGNMTAVFENGAKFHGCLIVAADGVHSTVRSKILPHVSPEVVPACVYHGEFTLPRVTYDTLLRPLIGNSNILAGVGDGFNTPITVCSLTSTTAHLDWSYSRAARGADDPLYRPNLSAEEAKKIPQALLDEIAERKLAAPWSSILNAEAMKGHSVFHWTSRCVLVEKKDLESTAEKGIVFVGDSWHAMPIFGGEGGCHALVDAVELTKSLGECKDVGVAVGKYYEGAWRRCQDAVRRSKGRFYILHRPMSDWKEIAEKKAAAAANGK